MEYLPQVKVSKKDLLVLSDLAGDMSIMDYMSKVIREHVAAQQSVRPTSDTQTACEHKKTHIETTRNEYCVECGDLVAQLS